MVKLFKCETYDATEDISLRYEEAENIGKLYSSISEIYLSVYTHKPRAMAAIRDKFLGSVVSCIDNAIDTVIIAEKDAILEDSSVKIPLPLFDAARYFAISIFVENLENVYNIKDSMFSGHDYLNDLFVDTMHCILQNIHKLLEITNGFYLKNKNKPKSRDAYLMSVPVMDKIYNILSNKNEFFIDKIDDVAKAFDDGDVSEIGVCEHIVVSMNMLLTITWKLIAELSCVTVPLFPIIHEPMENTLVIEGAVSENKKEEVALTV